MPKDINFVPFEAVYFLNELRVSRLDASVGRSIYFQMDMYSCTLMICGNVAIYMMKTVAASVKF